MSNLNLDRISREKIKSNIDNNYFVEAGAGSGKTTILVERLLTMVKKGVAVEKIAAITFTKAAASEFYDRFLRKLQKEKDNSENSEEEINNIENAIQNIDLCFMGTIDSFCGMVLNEHPIEAKIPSNASVKEDSELEKYYTREYLRILAGEYGKEAQAKGERFRRVVGWKDANRFVTMCKSLLDSRDAEVIYEEPVDDFMNEYANEIEIVKGAIAYIINNPDKKIVTTQAERAALEEAFVLNRGNYEESASDICKALNNISKIKFSHDSQTDIKKGITPKLDLFLEIDNLYPGVFIDTIDDKDKEIYTMNGGLLTELSDALAHHAMNIILDFIVLVKDEVSQVLRNEGILSFSDSLFYLRDLLKEDAKKEGKLIEYIYNRHSYFLIDEFQDTAPTQAQVFFYLAAQKPIENWKECIPKPGSLFIVGDPKQSIYRFRGADVSSYLTIKELFKKAEVGEVLNLTRNFRSNDVMRDTFNKVFVDLIQDAAPYKQQYEIIPLENEPKCSDKDILSGWYKYEYDTKTTKDVVGKICSYINEIVDNDKISITYRYNDKNGEVTYPKRKISYKDIMIITRGKSTLANYTKAFVANNIPFKVEGSVDFNECKVLHTISAIYSGVLHSTNRTKVFMSEYLSGIEIDDDKLKSFNKSIKEDTASSLFVRIIDEFKVLQYIENDNLEYVYYALELIRSAENDGTILSKKDGESFLKNLLENGNGLERYLQLTKQTDRVHLANLHKVKGLEAPVVILVNSKKTTKKPSSHILYNNNDIKGYYFELASDSDEYTAPFHDSNYVKEEDTETKHLEEEIIRLLYVAATRAGNALILPEKLTKDGVSDNEYWYRLSRYADKRIEEFLENKIKKEEIKEKDDEEIFDVKKAYKSIKDKPIFETKASYSLKSPSKKKTIEVEGESVKDASEDLEKKPTNKKVEDKKGMNAATLGTMTHSMMEWVINSKKNVKDVEALIEYLLSTNNIEEDNKDIYRSYLKEIYETMVNKGGYKQNNDVPQDIINEVLEAEECYCEVPFCYKREEEIWNGYIDLLYKKEGKWHIIDYKTDEDEEGIEDRHRHQMEEYEKAIKEIMNIDADARIYHIAIKGNYKEKK